VFTRVVRKATHNLRDTAPHPPYSPHLAPTDYRLLRRLAKDLLKRHFTSGEEVHREIRPWLMGLDCFCSGMGNPVKRWDKCLNKHGDYVEKQLAYTCFFLYFHFGLIKHFPAKKLLHYFPDNPRNTVKEKMFYDYGRVKDLRQSWPLLKSELSSTHKFQDETSSST
jgi:hypothetical protein